MRKVKTVETFYEESRGEKFFKRLAVWFLVFVAGLGVGYFWAVKAYKVLL